MSETKEVSDSVVKTKSRIPNIADIRVPEIIDFKEVGTTRANKRNAYLEQVAQHLVYNVPTRSEKGGRFDNVTVVEYFSIDDDEWHEIEQKKAKLFDTARIQAMSLDDYKSNGIPVPKNFMTLSQEYYKTQDEYNDMLLRLFLHKERSEVKLYEQKMIQDICDAYELKHRMGLVNFQVVSPNSESISSIM